LLTLGCVTLAIPLALFAWTGSNMRYTGDDYCYAGLFRQRGFWETIRSTYLGPSPFHGNRYSLTVFSGFAGMIGPAASAALPALTIVMGVAGVAYAARAGARAFSVRVSGLESLLAAEGVVFYGLALSPELAQSLYWRSGMLPYFLPIVLLFALAGLGLAQSNRVRPAAWGLGLIFALAVFAGGLSETSAALQLTALAIALPLVLLARRQGGRRLPSGLPVVATALAGTAQAIALLVASPSNRYALAGLEQTTRLSSLLRMMAFHAYLFLHGLAFRQWLPALALFGLYFWLAATITQRHAQVPNASWRLLVPAGAVILVAWLAIVLATMLPSAYAQSSYPVGRALTTSTFASTLAIAGYGMLAGFYTAGRLPSGKFVGLTTRVVILAAATLAPFMASRSAWSELGHYRRWSQFWDVRDRQIREMRSRGDSGVEVVLMDKIIPDVAELQPNADFWYNNCAEWYYDIESLSASLPGWDQ